ncbi:hypothetical protein DM01DRAFT_1331847 [Hesseltinella vesiculosa]|uniref:Uncharacterized protein n=1 Tax=Hesseltinella vesiculosa TaxID=101127 RepID=A0A1X2GWK8_9FUNG|nr:hypothetical protein DM01DRAFT_1331847 [Hesseltinella vesiculosa]
MPPMLPMKKESPQSTWRGQRTNTDMIAEELVQLYQDLLDKHDHDQLTIKKLQLDVEIFEGDSTKVRDYEIRVEYLAQKLEQITEEKEAAERELLEYKKQASSLVTPLSPEFDPEDYLQHPSGEDEDIKLQLPPTDNQDNAHPPPEEDDGYFDGILDAYDEPDREETHDQEVVEQQMLEYEQGMQRAMQQYVLDLERQRLLNRQLQSVIDKQDKLISTLEGNRPASVVNNPKQDQQESEEILLRQQVDLQRIELESKRDLLTQLLNEREELLKSVHGSQSTDSVHPLYRHNSNRSSIDILAELAQVPNARDENGEGEARRPARNNAAAAAAIDRKQSPTPPPRTPLPPVPMTTDNSPAISYSRSSSLSSPISWTSQERSVRQPTKEIYAHPHDVAASPKSFWKS